MDPLRVLVVERDAGRRDELVSLLRGARLDPVPSSPEAAAEALAATAADALLVNLRLPDLDLGALRRALSPGNPGDPESLESAERRHLALVLRHTSGNKRKAAHLLGISRSTLLNKVRKYRLESARRSD
jgi:DNA-binding NtrC family response regulator